MVAEYGSVVVWLTKEGSYDRYNRIRAFLFLVVFVCYMHVCVMEKEGLGFVRVLSVDASHIARVEMVPSEVC